MNDLAREFRNSILRHGYTQGKVLREAKGYAEYSNDAHVREIAQAYIDHRTELTAKKVRK